MITLVWKELKSETQSLPEEEEEWEGKGDEEEEEEKEKKEENHVAIYENKKQTVILAS